MSMAILLMGHGSRIPEANSALNAIAEMVRVQTGCEIVEVSFREQHAPNIQEGIDRCVERGATRILLYPYFLFPGAHVLEDLPAEMAQAARRYPDLQMILGEPLGVHPKLGEIVCERIGDSLLKAGWSVGSARAVS
jgi:sirohydrochlorin ferrochelatase